MPDTTVKLQDITPVKSTFDNDDQILLINPTGEARISKEDFLDAMPDDAITLIGDITTTGIEGDTVAKQLGALKNSKAPAITETTESSAIANFTDGADDLVMHNIVAKINPVQSGSGDPSPSNVRPISGWTGCNVTRTGANVWDEEWELGSFNSNGQPSSSSTSIRCKNFIPVASGQTYYMYSGSGKSNAPWMYGIDKSFIRRSSAYLVNQAFTIPEDVHYIKIALPGTYGTTYNHDISINYPATDHDYHAYQGSNTVTVDWTTEAGTVYGGTIDVATGLLTVDRAYVTFNGSDSSGWSRAAVYGTATRFDKSIAGLKPNSGASLLCNYLKRGAIGTSNLECCNVHGSSPVLQTQITTSRLSADSVAGLMTYFASNPLSIVYQLTTPQTYQLTPQEVKTLLGTNNVWADTGNVSVTYPADTKLYIQNLTQPSEDDMTANQAITSGKYFMIGNSLYLALANIASGAQITIGTNAQRVSLADALNTINS